MMMGMGTVRTYVGICLLAAALFGLSACAFSQQRLTSLDETLRLYGDLMRWGRYEQALAFHEADGQSAESLNNIRITDYVMYDRVISDDHNTAYQKVEIRYYNETIATERHLVDRQQWRYDNDKNRWRLHSPIPAFR